MSRAFSNKQRRYLAILSGGHCQQCGKALNGILHADHVIPYSKKGATSLVNGQALCPKCNLKKGNKIMAQVGTPPLREWQNLAKNDLLKEWAIENSKPLIAACPGAGKTMLAVSACKEAFVMFDVVLVILVCPSINIKEQWLESFKQFGIAAHARAKNEDFRCRIDQGLSVLEGNKVYCITYAQLSKDAELFELIARKYKVLTIADEVHHADDSEAFGRALERLSDASALRLSLSGTPFNSSGGALAMCEYEEFLNDEGRNVRKVIPLLSYNYSRSIVDGVCRPVEFVTVLGKATLNYQSLSNNSVYKKVIDLVKQNKTDSIGPLLEPTGEFFSKMANEALNSLARIKEFDRRAGMLVVVKDKNHGSEVARVLTNMIEKNKEWAGYSVQEIYNDTERAHNRIKQLNHDHTDIVITVRMISEGVDVKRLRVGLYATDYRTRMFFTQFVGRFVRWETRIDDGQFACVIIPAHPDLILFAREIEIMVNEAIMKNEVADGTPPPSPENILIGSETEATGDGIIYRSESFNERDLANEFYKKYPEGRGIPEAVAIKLMKDLNQNGQSSGQTDSKPLYQPDEDWDRKNQQLVSRIVNVCRMNGHPDPNSLYAKINKEANVAVGIPRKDRMTPEHKLKERHAYLLNKLRNMKNLNWGDNNEQ